VHPVNYIHNHPEFWTDQRIVKEAWRFHNEATTFGKNNLKDEQNNDLYLNKLDIDSEEVFTRLQIFASRIKTIFSLMKCVKKHM
jgi:hypothetical protein